MRCKFQPILSYSNVHSLTTTNSLLGSVAALPQPHDHHDEPTIFPEKPDCPSGQRPKAVSDSTCSCNAVDPLDQFGIDATSTCCGKFEGANFDNSGGPACIWDPVKWARNAPSKFQNCCAKQEGIDPNNIVCGTATKGYICVDEK